MYRILTENKNRERIEELLEAMTEGFTIFTAQGYWKGESVYYREDSLAIELVNVPYALAATIAQRIKIINDQEAVLILTIPATAEFI
jgi:hypothetical protein